MFQGGNKGEEKGSIYVIWEETSMGNTGCKGIEESICRSAGVGQYTFWPCPDPDHCALSGLPVKFLQLFSRKRLFTPWPCVYGSVMSAGVNAGVWVCVGSLVKIKLN